MESAHDRFTQHFYDWERRGRGWKLFESSVHLEPPFKPFVGHILPEPTPLDDGRRPTLLSSWFRRLTSQPEAPPVIPEPEEEPEPEQFEREEVVEIQTSLPADLDIATEAVEQMLLNLGLCGEPIAFELLGVPGRVSVQFAASPNDASLLRRQLQAHFPDVVFQQCMGVLEAAWKACPGDDVLVFEVGLAREFLLPLSSGKLDPFIGIIGALAELQPGELGVYQVLLQAAREPWTEHIMRSVTDDDGKPFFANMPELVRHAQSKTSRPLYAAAVRLAVKSERYERTLQIAKDLAGSLRAFASPNGNELIPLENDDYPLVDHVDDLIRRQTRRAGMLLNSAELTGFVHLPSSAVRSPVFQRKTGKTKSAPAIVRRSTGILLGANTHAGETVEVRLIPEQRVRHMHIIGASGTGKSTLLYNLVLQDIENGEGVAVLDPHGDLVDRILGVIPESRIDDVVLVDPADEEYSVGFNILGAHSELEKNLLSSDLVSVFQRLSTSWGDQMASVLNNAIIAFLESSRGGTLADLRRFLLEPAYREQFLETVRDPDIAYYWKKGFAQLAGNKSIGPVLTRLETFLARKPIRYMVSQKENRLDFAQIMDTGKIFLAKLSQGLLGKENSYLLGTLLVSKFQQIAMSRQQQAQTLRRDFWLYIDEFAYFIAPSMAEILTGARKYRVGLILAHQELRQLQKDSDVASAVMSHPVTRISFRVGDDDARKLAHGFASFETRDLQNLETGTAIARVERSDFDFNLSVWLPTDPAESEAAERRKTVIDASRRKYANPMAEVKARLREEIPPEDSRPKSPPDEPKPPPGSEGPQEPPPKPPGSGKPEPPPPQKAAPERPAARPTAEDDVGRGGPQHQAIQRRIKEAGQGAGFRSDIEFEILAGEGKVDVLLTREDQTIACEIPVSHASIDKDFGNVEKCLKAGYRNVAIIGIEPDRLKKIERAVSGSLGEQAAALVRYYEPDQFIAHLKGLPRPELKAGTKNRRGYTVKRSKPNLSPEEEKRREEAAIRSIAESMRRKDN